jgi:hypothetical protein
MRAGGILLSQPRHRSITSRATSTSLSPPEQPGSGPAEAQLLLKQLAGIVAESFPADYAL